MKIFSLNLMVLTALLLTSTFGFARRSLTSQEIENMLLKMPVDYSGEGVVAEEIARLEVYQLFPIEEFEIRRGLEYFDKNGKTIGELDIVVFNRATGKVAMIGEVKGGSSEAGLRKAFQQKERFLEYLNNGWISRISLRSDPSVSFELDHFDSQWNFQIIGVRGQHQQQLLDIVLHFTRKQITELSRRLRQFQRYRWRDFRRRSGSDINFHHYISRLGSIDQFDFTELFRDYNCARIF